MDHKPVELDANDPQFTWDGAPKLMMGAFAVGGVGLLAAAGIGAAKGDHFARFLHSYHVAFVFFLAIALGCLFFVTLHHLVRAGWSVVVRRLFEFGAGTMPIMAALAIPIVLSAVMGNNGLFIWVEADLAKDHLLAHKTPYLNVPFFVIRVLAYFGLWIMMARYFVGFSKKQDSDGDWRPTAAAQGHAAPLMIFFGLTLTFAAVDFIMALEPHWYSTIIGVYYFATAVMSSMASMILFAKFLQSRGKIQNVVTVEHFHDLGKLLFAFTFFWAYIAFSQYMLIWYANIPEGTIWYQHRQHGAWVPFSFFLLFGHFIIPFLGLISRNFKRQTNLLAFWAGWMLFMHWVDMFYLVMPSLYEHKHAGYDVASLPLSIMDLLCMVGVGGIFIGAMAMGMRGSFLVPMKDPRLNESLAFENM